MNDGLQIHATAVAINGSGVMILGPSGSGKSDLALRLIDRGAILIADDQIIIKGQKNKPLLNHSAHHINAIEVRGIGIIEKDCVNNIPLRLAIELNSKYERSPRPFAIRDYGIYSVPMVKISPWEHSAAIKIELALNSLDQGYVNLI